MYQTSTVVFCAVDSLISSRGKTPSGFERFLSSLEHAHIPVVWITNRTRAELDPALREMDHHHPFIGEGGCGVYLPMGYFHVHSEKTVRLGRFLCIPTAKIQPAAREALQELSQETNVEVAAASSLSARELSQNLGVPAREAELARLRDFDELFFFAGASQEDIQRFVVAAQAKNSDVRGRGIFWSLAIGASVTKGIQDLNKLYERTLSGRPTLVGIATPEEASTFFSACRRTILIHDGKDSDVNAANHKGVTISIHDEEVWEKAFQSVLEKL